ncbi:MAG: Ribonuclease [Myxococcaceae bacterium]|nr:Ribonuclease [Myxococcaceae bacterium]
MIVPLDEPLGAIDCADEARALAARLFTESTIALDTEGDGMFRYRTQLCTIQLASEHELAVVDTLAPDVRVSMFAELMSSRGPEKVVHDAAFDARLLAAYGAPLGAVFDTAVAARYLGFSATGLASLLLQLFDVTVPKHMQQADWGRRPLSLEAIEYLENDVRYLIPLRDTLLERLRERDIEAEMREECEYVLREARASVFEPSPFSRVKGALARPPEERARLYELANARDEIARELDLPAARVVPNDLLLRFGELHQPLRAELERRLPARHRAYAARFVDALARAEGQSDAPGAELPNPRDIPAATELARRKRRRELLTSFRAREASARGVDPQVVLPGHCVNELVKLDDLSRASLEQVSGLGECRIERYGEALRRAFKGRW